MNDSFVIELLFEKEVKKPTANAVFRLAKEQFGNIEIKTRSEELISFAVEKYVSYIEKNTTNVKLCMGNITSFDSDKNINDFERSQIWNIENTDEVLKKCKYSIKIFDHDATGQIPKERAIMLIDWLSIALKLFPDCVAIWVKSSGKLQLARAIKNFKQIGINKFIYNMVNIRFFNIPNSNEFIIDSVGLYNIGLSDVQFHFKGLNPNKVANLAYSLLWYILNNENQINDDDTVDGLDDTGNMTPSVQWKCRYEDSLIEPLRLVLDINTGKFSAGDRSN